MPARRRRSGESLPKAVGLIRPKLPTTLADGYSLAMFRHDAPAALTVAIVALPLSMAIALHLPVETVGSRFGDLPHGLPAPRLPPITPDLLLKMGPTALSFALLGAIESLLSATVADGMTARRHRPNMELVAQGVANVGSALFGGLPVTGTIARTATNVRAGARSPMAGIMHAAVLLAFMLVAAPLAAFVPLATLAGVLLVVAWNMAEKADIARLARQWRPAEVLITTFGLTLAKDLTTGIVAGCVLAGGCGCFARALRR